MSTACIDLRERFGKRFRVTCEESCPHIHHNSNCDPWYAIIPCQRGHIGVQGGERLLVSIDRRGPTACKLAAIPFVTITQDADDGFNATFDVEHFDAVAELMLPKRRRQLSPEQRERSIERLRGSQFKPGSRSTEQLSDAPRHANAMT